MIKMVNYNTSLYDSTKSLQRDLTNTSFKKPLSPVGSFSSSNRSSPTRQTSKIDFDNKRSLNNNNNNIQNNLHSPYNSKIPQYMMNTNDSSSRSSGTRYRSSDPLSNNNYKTSAFTSANYSRQQQQQQIQQQMQQSKQPSYLTDIHSGHSNSDIDTKERNVHSDYAPNNSHPSSSTKVNKNFLLKMKKKYKNKISANVSGTKFEIVRNVIEAIGCKILPDDNFDCNLIWDDTKVSVECISELKSFQRYNHFVAMNEISRKDALARNMAKMFKVLPNDFDFVPKTWIMPMEYNSLVSYALDLKKSQQKRTFIMKPSNGAMGNGIKLYKNVDKVQPTENYIVQEYISNPYLLDGYKFDLRIYALVTSCDPLRAFIFNNGLVRLGTETYQEPNESNIDHLYMHLTNYSVNKRNKHYNEGDSNGETGTKRSLKYLFEHFRRNGKDSSKVWRSIQDIILKTLLVVEPYLFHTYKMCRPGQIPGSESVCFEILGFDILLDDKLKPWVLEVNRSPSFGANQQIDFDIKSKLLIDSFELLHLRASDRQRSNLMEKSESKRRLYNLNNYLSKIDTASLNSVESLGNSNNLNKKYKSKERRKFELIEQLKLLRREHRRQEYENRNIGNFSRLFPIDDRQDMEFYLNILHTSFNLFYPIGKHVQWRKTYDRIREDDLINELAECDDNISNIDEYEQNRKINEYLKDDYMSTESEEESQNESDDDNREEDLRYRDYHHTHSYEYNYDQKYGKLRENDPRYDYSSKRLDDERYGNKNYENDENNLEINHEKSANFDKSQPKVSLNTLINREHIKENRFKTISNALSSSNSLLVVNKKSNSAVATKQARHSKESDNTLNNNYDKTIQIMNANNEISTTDQPTQNNSSKHLRDNKRNSFDSSSKLTSNSSSNLNVANGGISITNENDSKVLLEDEIFNNNIDTLTVAVLKLLTQLQIKFPGKTDEQTKTLLQKIYSKLEILKPKLGNYWMVKLDDTKRNKILNIVKTNVVVILQKVFSVSTIENLRLYKIFVKLLNRMLWMHGQGLWNCFTSTNYSSWETIFSKSSFSISENELKCCHRIVELCKDCVLIVYQYAFEQKPNNNESNEIGNNSVNKLTPNQTNNNSLAKLKNISASTGSLSLIKPRSK